MTHTGNIVWVDFGFALKQVSLNRLLHNRIDLPCTPEFIAPSMRGMSFFTYF